MIAGPDFTAQTTDVKDRIQTAPIGAVQADDDELTRLSWDIGPLFHQRPHREGWGAKISERDIGPRITLVRAYPDPFEIVRQPAVQLRAARLWQIPSESVMRW